MADAVERLWWHAGFGGGGEGMTVSEATATEEGSQIEAATADFIEGLAEYNRSLNGSVPSARAAGSGTDDLVSRRAAYSVAEVTRMLRDAKADDCARRVEIAWNAVLAGDIDDIPQHVALEDSAGA